MSLLTILDRLSGFIYPIYLLRGQWTAWAMLVPLPKDQISDRWNEWNMKRGGTMWNGETCNLVHSSWLPARPQIAVRKHGSLPCVPCVPCVPGKQLYTSNSKKKNQKFWSPHQLIKQNSYIIYIIPKNSEILINLSIKKQKQLYTCTCYSKRN